MPSYPMNLIMSFNGLGCLALDLRLMWWDRSMFGNEQVGVTVWQALAAGLVFYISPKLAVLKTGWSHNRAFFQAKLVTTAISAGESPRPGPARTGPAVTSEIPLFVRSPMLRSRCSAPDIFHRCQLIGGSQPQ